MINLEKTSSEPTEQKLEEERHVSVILKGAPCRSHRGKAPKNYKKKYKNKKGFCA